MRVDKFTRIIKIENENFLCNTKTGAIDEVDKFTANEVDRLQLIKSFTPLECNLSESLIEDLIERGYITYYSDKEETDEREWFLEKHREKAKKTEKTASILLDSVIGNNWCYEDAKLENLAMIKANFISLLKTISNKKLTNKIDLWLVLKDRINDWEWINNNVNKNGFSINSIYTIIKSEAELKKILTWFKTTPNTPKLLNIKYEEEDFKYFTLIKNNDNRIAKKDNVIFMGKHPFFCPFIYRTFFINESGSISYCVKKLVNVIDTMVKEITFENGWSKELFAHNCNEPDNCAYSIYCTKICSHLTSNYKSKNNNECNLVPIFDNLITEKIKSMV